MNLWIGKWSDRVSFPFLWETSTTFLTKNAIPFKETQDYTITLVYFLRYESHLNRVEKVLAT